MSLKAFHIIFICLSTALALLFGVWAVEHFVKGEASGLELTLGIISLALVPALIIYGKYFLRKLRGVSYL
jgi:hypothetical protein